MRKLAFFVCIDKSTDQLHSNCTSDSQILFTIYEDSTIIPLFPESSSHLMWLYISVCVRPGRKPRRQVFSCRSSYGAVVISSLIAKYDTLQLMLLYV